MADNTGYLIQPTLKYVTDDVDQFPLDVNGDLCSVSGLPQATMATPPSDPRYKVENTTICPLPTPPPSDDYTLTPVNVEDGDSSSVKVVLKNSLGVAVTVTGNISFNYSIALTPALTLTGSKTLLASNSERLLDTYDGTTYTYISTTITDISPTTVDGHNIN